MLLNYSQVFVLTMLFICLFPTLQILLLVLIDYIFTKISWQCQEELVEEQH